MKTFEMIKFGSNLLKENKIPSYILDSEILLSKILNKSREETLVNLDKKINEKNLSKYLQTADIPDPDILIRTGDTKRLSNFLLWQLAYSEIFFEKKLWPDFNQSDYNKIIKKFKKIKRNFGNI